MSDTSFNRKRWFIARGSGWPKKRSKEPNQDDLRQESGTKHSQHGLTSGLSSLAVSSLPQSLLQARQGLGLPGNGRSDPQAADGLGASENHQVPQSLATSCDALFIVG